MLGGVFIASQCFVGFAFVKTLFLQANRGRYFLHGDQRYARVSARGSDMSCLAARGVPSRPLALFSFVCFPFSRLLTRPAFIFVFSLL